MEQKKVDSLFLQREQYRESKRYSHVPLEIKQQLINLCKTNSVRSAAKMMGINYSTAKHIV